ncbi:MAG: nitroreductase family protein, partial [Chloroflexota bacterium]
EGDPLGVVVYILVDDIDHPGFPVDRCPGLESLPSYEKLIAALRQRRSLRVYRDKPVPRQTVRQLVDASRWAPSATNRQAVDWIAIDDPARIARLSEEVATTCSRLAPLLRNRLLRPFLTLMLGKDNAREAIDAADDFERLGEQLEEGADLIFYEAPVVLVAHGPRGAFFGREDAVYAAYHLMLAAERLGLGTCHVGYVNAALERNRSIEQLVGLPEGRQVEVVRPSATPASPSAVPSPAASGTSSGARIRPSPARLHRSSRPRRRPPSRCHQPLRLPRPPGLPPPSLPPPQPPGDPPGSNVRRPIKSTPCSLDPS